MYFFAFSILQTCVWKQTFSPVKDERYPLTFEWHFNTLSQPEIHVHWWTHHSKNLTYLGRREFNSTLHQSSHGLATHVHGFSTKTTLAREIPPATQASDGKNTHLKGLPLKHYDLRPVQFHLLQSLQVNLTFFILALLKVIPTHRKCCHCCHFIHRMCPDSLPILEHLLQVSLSCCLVGFVDVDLVAFFWSALLIDGSSSLVVTWNGKPFQN